MIRIATTEDAEELVRIYQEYVLHTAITTEYEVPALPVFRERIRRTLERYPYLVSVHEGRICGYTYAGPFRVRPAYGWAVETSIYVDRQAQKHGIGKELYRALERALQLQNILNMNACIGYPDAEDEYLTKNSFCFHEHMGFQQAAKFHKVVYKFRRWYGIVWMEKFIGMHTAEPLPVRPFPEVAEAFLAQQREAEKSSRG